MRVVLLLLPFFIFSQNTLSGSSLNVNENTSFEYEIGLDNDSAVSALQFDIDINQGAFTYGSNHTLTTRASGFTVSSSNPSENIVRVVMYSSSGSVIEVGSGTILKLDISSKTLPNDYTFSISNVVLSDATGTELSSSSSNGTVSVRGAHLNVNTTSIDFGRVPITETKQQVIRLTNNGSAELSISSIVKDVSLFDIDTATPFTISQGAHKDITLTFTPSSNGDVDQDISIRHNGSTEQNIINVTADVFSPNYLSIDDIEVLNGESYNLLFRLHNYNSVKGVQVDIDFPQGFSFDFSNMVMSSSTTNFSISSSSLSNGNRRIIIYNTSGESISAGSEVLFELPFSVNNDTSYNDYTLAYSNVVISDQSNQDVSSETLTSGKISVVQSLSVKDFADSIQVYPNPFSDKIIISSESLVDISVYNILGSEVLKENSVNVLNTSALKQGIYIFKIEYEGLETYVKMVK